MITAPVQSLPDTVAPTENSLPQAAVVNPPLRKVAIRVRPGQSEYKIAHNLQTEQVIVQTSIAGRIREGGISILDANTVQLTFGGVLNEAIDVVIIG